MNSNEKILSKGKPPSFQRNFKGPLSKAHFDTAPYLVLGKLKVTRDFLPHIHLGICGLIAMAVFTGKVKGDDFSYYGIDSWGWSFILGWVGTILVGLTGVIAIVISFIGKGNSSSSSDQPAPSGQVDVDPSPATPAPPQRTQ